MSTSTPHDELAALLAASPRVENFSAVRTWLESQPEGPAREAALARAVEGLRSWPDAVRWAPEDWLYALARGEVHPLWPLIRRIDVSFLDEQKFAVVFASPALANITDLRVKAWSGKPQVLSALFASPHLDAVTSLDIASFGPNGVRALLASAMPARLRRLVVGLDDETARSLAGTAALRGLLALEVSLYGVTGESASILLRSPHLQRLRELRLASLHEDAASAALAAGFPELRVLSLQGARLGRAALQAVFGAPFFAELEELDLTTTRIDPSAAGTLVGNLGPRLRILDVSGTGFPEVSVMALARSPGVDALRELRLGGCTLGSVGLLALVRAPRLANVRVTGFYVRDQLTREVLRELVASQRFVDHPRRADWRYQAELLDLSLRPDEASAPIPADARFAVYRPAPFAPWQGHEISVDARGQLRATFEDPQQGDRVIERSGQAGPAVVKVLVATVARVQFFAVQPDGEDIGPHCATFPTNGRNTMGLVTVTLGGVTRTISLAPGCFSSERTRALLLLIDRISLLAAVNGVSATERPPGMW